MNKYALERLRMHASKPLNGGTHVSVLANDLDAILISHEKLGKALAASLGNTDPDEALPESVKVLKEEQGAPWDR